MDANRFDVFVRSLDRAVPRRVALVGALGAGLTAFLAHFGVEVAEGKGRKKKKKCKSGKKKCGKKCFDLQTDPLHCGSCGNRCDDDMVCRAGECVCPDDETACGDTCCASSEICVDGQCEDDLCPPEFTCPLGQACVNGDCTCPFGACDAADDPGNDQFEGCFCGETVEGEQACFGIGACTSPPPTCATSAECGTGFACQASSCGDVARCGQLCDLS